MDQRKLTESEIEERVSILKKLREYLRKQREQFYTYLEILNNEEQDILQGDTEKLKQHTEIERNIVDDIFEFQKVIDPLDEIYRVSYPAQDRETSQIKTTLKHIQDEALKRSRRNQKLLHERMEGIRNEIRSLRKINKNKPLYNAEEAAPSLIDIST